MSIFIDLEMNTTDVRLVHKKDLRNEIIEIGAVTMRFTRWIGSAFSCGPSTTV